MGRHRQVFLAQALQDLEQQLILLGSGLLQLRGSPAQVLPALARRWGPMRTKPQRVSACWAGLCR